MGRAAGVSAGVYCLERVSVLAKAKPELKDIKPFKTVLSGDRAAMAKLPIPELEKSSPPRSPA